jgi:uncharacterized membrane protein YsdA (DUF1294 family)
MVALGYLASINIIAFFTYGLDKLYARGHAWRITERTLLIIALLGGTVGALAGIKLFRHKTRKSSFLIWIAIILVIQIGAVLWFFTLFDPPSYPLDLGF